MGEGLECGDDKEIVLSEDTSDPAICARLASERPECGAYFEVRLERFNCRCIRATETCLRKNVCLKKNLVFERKKVLLNDKADCLNEKLVC